MSDTKIHKGWGKKRGDVNRRRRAAQAACTRVGVSPGAVRTYVYLLTQYSNDFATTVWPSQERIALELGVSSRTICRHVKLLEQAGLWDVERGPIVREDSGQVHRSHTNRYRFVVPKGSPNRKKPSSSRHDTGDTQNHITTLCKDKTLRVNHVFDQNCSSCEGTGWAETLEGDVERCSCARAATV